MGFMYYIFAVVVILVAIVLLVTINAVFTAAYDKRKHEFAIYKALGFTNGQIFRKIILLQLIKRIVPPISNEIITLVKDTSLARVIAVYEIIWNGQSFIKSAGIVWPLFYTGIFYLLFSGLLTLLFRYLEQRLSYFR